jgi:glutathione S-transferase
LDFAATKQNVSDDFDSAIQAVNPNYVTDRDRKAKGKTIPGYHPDIDVPHTDPFEFYYNEVSANSLKVRIAVVESGLPITYKHIELTHDGDFETKREPFLRVNPSGTLPVLVYDGHPCYDSVEHLKFLSRLAPEKGLMPDHPNNEKWIACGSMEGFFMGEDAVEQLMSSLGTNLPWISIPMFLYHEDTRSPLEMISVLASGGDLAEGNALMKIFGIKIYEDAELGIANQTKPNPFIVNGIWANLRRGIRHHFANMEADITATGGPFLCGEQFGIGDVSVATFFQRAEIMLWLDELLPEFPVCAGWWAAVKARPAYKGWLPKYAEAGLDLDKLHAWINKKKRNSPQFAAAYAGTY